MSTIVVITPQQGQAAPLRFMVPAPSSPAASRATPNVTPAPSARGSMVTSSTAVTPERLVTDQPGRPDGRLVTPALTDLTDEQREIIALCAASRKHRQALCRRPGSHTVYVLPP